MEKQLTALPVNSIITGGSGSRLTVSYIENTAPYMLKENSYMGLLLAWRLAKNITVTVRIEPGNFRADI